ncbi:MAG TPA: hypothetical protein VGY99_06130 [Candidatus Binataceae bacterium]|nr:hypothetical protein [Candidatus Binataceae bacterium]
MKISDEGRCIDAMLRHLGCGHDLHDFPGTPTEKVALVRIAGTRRLIAWQKARVRYELTALGWDRLMPSRRFGVGSLVMSAASGGAVGAIALAILWLPGDPSHPSVHRHSSASISRVEKPYLLQASHSAEVPAPRPDPLPVTNVSRDAVAVAAEPDPDEVSRATDRPAADPPRAEVPLSAVKETEVKKYRRKAAHHRRREHGRTWARADRWRAQSIRYAGYGGWLGYR